MVALTYPGVRSLIVSSGSRTIATASSSVAAFLGAAPIGPVDEAVPVLSWDEYERVFGGLAAGLDLGYAVRHFFLNGGSEARIVRVGVNPMTARTMLANRDGLDVLELTARESGPGGNQISVSVDYATANPGSLFNLTITRTVPGNPNATVSEVVRNLSLSSGDLRHYAPTVIGRESRLVNATRPAGVAAAVTGSGTSTSGQFPTGTNFQALIDAQHDQIDLVVDTSGPVTLTVPIPAANSLAALQNALAAAIAAAPAGTFPAPPVVATTGPSGAGFVGGISITSATTGENSRVWVRPAATRNVTTRLLLGIPAGGTEVDAAATIRPEATPVAARIRGGTFANAGDFPPAAPARFILSLNGVDTTVNFTVPAAGGSVAANAATLAGLIDAQLGTLPGVHATVFGTGNNSVIEINSGNAANGTTLQIRDAAAAAGITNNVATLMHLTAGSNTSRATVRLAQQLAGGALTQFDPANPAAAFTPTGTGRRGLRALDPVDFNLLVLPGITDATVLAEAGAYVTDRGAFLIAESRPTDTTPAQAAQGVNSGAYPHIPDAAVYYPWIVASDPLQDGALRPMPPGGAIAGVFARTDANRGPWKGPAGIDTAIVGAVDLAYDLTLPEIGTLYPLGMNCLRGIPGAGVVVWGTRTRVGADADGNEWKDVPVRRMALLIQQSLLRGTEWVVFEPNDEPLWSQIRVSIGAFLQNLYRQGAFAGRSPREAYFVRCDAQTTPEDDRRRGVVNIQVGFAPLRPAEFVIIRIQQMAGQAAGA
ncbi:MAG: phage tail sheath subtilisin-like domain-containing protein [Verrucomicrobiota bacterium]|jgi:phage tail sheath protein FI